MSTMTPTEIVALMKSDCLLNKVGQLFSEGYANIEQSSVQRIPATILEIRTMEFEIARKVIKLITSVDSEAEGAP